MRSRDWTIAIAALALLVAPAAASAQSDMMDVDGYRGEFLQEIEEREERFVSLAEAFPQEDYEWRPMEGVRSVAEAFLHVVSSNYFFPTFTGVEPPEGVDMQELEHSTMDKAEIVRLLERSFDHLKRAVAASPDSPERMVSWFGDSQITHRAYLIALTGHYGEHLGQAIAYARMNGVVPPWSAAASE